jgi:predicted alpha/beta-fold hydrolase
MELQHLDEAVYMPTLGYKELDDMHRLTIIRGNLSKIKVPTLHISADDD